MARPREFDRNEALDKAINIFWLQGYDGTSVQDLVDTMGIQRGSLYAAFGDKHQLFLEALDRYEQAFHCQLLELLRSSAKEGIRQLFAQVVVDCSCDRGNKGCFITNTAVGLSQGDAETAVRIQANFLRMENAFAEALERARISGELTDEHEPRALARFLTNSLQGLRVLSKSSIAPEVLAEVVSVSLSVLDPPRRGLTSLSP